MLLLHDRACIGALQPGALVLHFDMLGHDKAVDQFGEIVAHNADRLRRASELAGNNLDRDYLSSDASPRPCCPNVCPSDRAAVAL
jgi:hypothetical protein